MGEIEKLQCGNVQFGYEAAVCGGEYRITCTFTAAIYFYCKLVILYSYIVAGIPIINILHSTYSVDVVSEVLTISIFPFFDC